MELHLQPPSRIYSSSLRSSYTPSPVATPPLVLYN
jgi:hypothetical protein